LPRKPDPGPRPVRILHQFPVSPACEKVRWVLDAKRLEYTVRNLFPGWHARVNRKLVGETAVPVLIDGERVVHDSRGILQYLEQTHPERRLLPDDEGLRALVLALETYFDRTVGPAVSHWVFGQLLRKRGAATRAFFAGYARGPRMAGQVAGLLFERRLRRMYPPDEESLASAERTILDGIERLENTIDRNPERLLVGDSLTLADITAASLLGPIIGPAQSPWPDSDRLLPPIRALRARLRERPGGLWVLRRYLTRHPQPALLAPMEAVAASVSPAASA
jgi:glutathione S-transferase